MTSNLFVYGWNSGGNFEANAGNITLEARRLFVDLSQLNASGENAQIGLGGDGGAGGIINQSYCVSFSNQSTIYDVHGGSGDGAGANGRSEEVV